MSDTVQPGFDTPSTRPNARRDLSASAIAAGLVAVLVSFGGTAVLMVQAGHAAGLDAARIGSWIGSLSLVLGLGGAAYSLRTGLPIVMAWSTPGAALLVTALAGVPFPEAIGAFVLAAALTLACGLFGWIDPILRRIPGEVAAAMLAGVLLNFGMGIFTNVGKQPALVLAMCAAYLVCRRWAPRYAVLVVMAVAVAMAAGLGLIQVDQLDWHLTEFVWTTPVFSMQAAVSLGVPLFVVAMASQNLPGLAILQAAGYRPPASRLVAATGLLGLLAAPFGAHSVTLGAISAAICTGPEAHAEPSKRYIAAATYGVSYFALSIVAGAVAVFFQALPAALLAALAGLALLGTIMGGMAAAMANPQRREAALITLLATASGFSFWGIGSAFWGLVAGLLAHTVFEYRRKPAA
ncbi:MULTISPECIES: benzoate/H(+) symporter BenE family transporter [Achromobacter]|uniref:Inner membrane protein ydcO n=4 Tax=Alcaligenes xylosoxydans xylosoxydans TaxID=85698 RepID=A0A1R1JQ29_ALCXX|nr:benzoate/H(+) symporter BenE family transporter [Achromobacter xylosoxidans]KMJ90693.1 membrane protein [Achromobacter xylosoxidans]MBK1982264.1 benzoate/H(+) symporter BenE family transporter [Achromobacter xylosoxidans]MCZ8438028.1 benzoate/H(+) symporter BenE family transporter [Achromobacter xylosoxidans]MDD7988051.1 benzoate/H(+) symporter BenE family transporter [Achromobacter xylosoxidans]MEC6409503.1 benzoate/H(+) symporter BenE family transporter [Achromobacter xylosoxidans]